MKKLRIAYIGCGAVVERSHLPAVMNCPNFLVSCLIDHNETQRAKLAQQYNINYHGDSFDEFVDEFDVAVIATPSATHFALAHKLLTLGKHVLVEKPLAIDYASALALVELAQEKERTLAVSLVRRYLSHFKLFKSMLDAELLGDVRVFTVEEGGVFNWPVQDARFYDHNASGGGVLLDNGAHLLDACLWWLGDYDTVRYQDDAQGGVEAECFLEVTLNNGAQGTVAMSRLRQLSNKIEVVGEKGKLCMDLVSGDIDLMINGASVDLRGNAYQGGEPLQKQTRELFENQYHCFHETVMKTHSSAIEELVLGDDCLESIRLIEECYKNRQLLSTLVI